MPKPHLHELLAAEPDLARKASTALSEAADKLRSPHLFNGSISHYTPFSEEESHLAEESYEEVGASVDEVLHEALAPIVNYWDATFQKEATNQTAMAHLIVDGETIAEDLPATFLLGMETKLRLLRNVLEAIPTLDPKTAWELAADMGENVYAASHPEERFRTRKVTEPVVLYEATEHHPAQVRESVKDVHVGKLVKQMFSAAVPRSRRLEILDRIDKLIQGVKQARQRANQQEVSSGIVGQKIANYLLA